MGVYDSVILFGAIAFIILLVPVMDAVLDLLPKRQRRSRRR